MLQSEMLAGNRRVSDDNLSLNSLPDADVQPGDSANTHFRINTETSSGEENIAQTVTSSSQNGLDAVAASGVTSETGVNKLTAAGESISAAENAAEKERGTTSTHGRIGKSAGLILDESSGFNHASWPLSTLPTLNNLNF